MNEEQELPQGWVLSNIGELLVNRDGERRPINSDERAKRKGEFDYYGASGIIDKIDGYLFDEPLLLIGEDGANLLSRSTPIAFIASGKYWVNNHAHVLGAHDFITIQFAKNYINSIDLAPYVTGTAQPKLNQANLNKIEIPVPPLPEQRRIVAKLEELFSRLDAGVAAVRRTQALLKRYRQSVLHAAVTGELTRAWREAHPAPTETGAALLTRIRTERRAQWESAQSAKRGGQLPLSDAWKSKYVAPAAPEISGLPELPENWSWATFEEISERVTVGFVGSMKDEYVEEGVPFLRSQNVRENKYSSLGLKYISPAFDESISKSRLEPGDVVVVRSGSVGTACVIPDTLLAANCSDLVIVKQPKVLPEYCAYYMNSVAKARVNAQKVGVALIHFNTQAQAAMPLSIPPVEEQAEIVAEVERRLTVLDVLSQTLTAELKRAERLRQSLLHRAFTGRLVPQDATDEPAAALLARLQAETAAAPAKGKAGRGRKAAGGQTALF
ncbi:restriction endonuclease subunit S [Hymenobacter elongatus]|uniref:Type I restriction modification DNA specificity domain-containing protein n=1 Tax=Hymenobacter elongatus TaxID=877208 RepID=A0A4Z0PG83_9BACT|nr:restriction endonuclease subunit S [Hymenobacter elongatus]TGE13812.1 hypothetical protein E5J99_18840 [Hymenobacter elongatus]